jgi:hypothetical protein
MTLVTAYHTDTDPEDPVHHNDDCPAGKRVIADGNAIQGSGNYRMCDFCTNKLLNGKFAA